MMRVAVLQSNYIPWKGYFDIIHSVDRFIFYDDVQFTARDWRNRNRIKTPQGVQWLTVPVGNDVNRQINEVEIIERDWQRTHWETIRRSYARAPQFKKYESFFREAYCDRMWTNLSELNRYFVERIARDFLGIGTEFGVSTDYAVAGQKSDRLLSLVRQTGADVYVSGPSARDYLDEDAFRAANIRVEYMDYSGYPEYPQPYPPFAHDVSILDLLFQMGDDAPQSIWGWRESSH
jgi:hypothetical protein